METSKRAREPGRIAWRPAEIEAGAGHGRSTYSTSSPPPSPHRFLHIAIPLSNPPLLHRATSPAPETNEDDYGGRPVGRKRQRDMRRPAPSLAALSFD
nr:unnamed protein product [Digitaria exilis]